MNRYMQGWEKDTSKVSFPLNFPTYLQREGRKYHIYVGYFLKVSSPTLATCIQITSSLSACEDPKDVEGSSHEFQSDDISCSSNYVVTTPSIARFFIYNSQSDFLILQTLPQNHTYVFWLSGGGSALRAVRLGLQRLVIYLGRFET